jgi:DNA polymerase III sliding clamp (beta) subunit (PCNA family)
MKFLQTLNEDEIDIKKVGEAVQVKSKKAQIKFPIITSPPLEFDRSDEGDEYVLPEDTMKGINICSQFMSKDETQPQYRGVYVDKDYVYATDGFRLARYKAESDFSFFIPDAFCQLMLVMIPKTLKIHDNHLKCITRSTRAYSTVLSPAYSPPDYAKIFTKLEPYMNKNLIKLGYLGGVFDRGAIFTSGMIDKYGKLQFTKDGCSIIVNNEQVGLFNEYMETEGGVTEDIELTLDVPLLQTVLLSSDAIEVITEGIEYPVLRGERGKFEVLLTTLN